MDYYKSTINNYERVCAADKTTGRVSVIINYNGTGMYNVINQQLSTTKESSQLYSMYETYLLGFESITKSEFTTHVDLAKSFLNTL